MRHWNRLDELDERIESTAREWPRVVPDDELWNRIETRLQQESRGTEPRSVRRGVIVAPLRLREVFSRPALVLAFSVALLVVGMLAGIVLVTVLYPALVPEFADTAPQRKLERAIQEDIDKAILYQERAIAKLTLLAEKYAKELDPKYVAVQMGKIESLRTAVAECKAAMELNGPHPRIQHYLFTAYSEWRDTLSSLVKQSDAREG